LGRVNERATGLLAKRGRLIEIMLNKIVSTKKIFRDFIIIFPFTTARY